jgi:hypothetical protein
VRRARKLTIARGLPGKARRRCARLLRRVLDAPYGVSVDYAGHGPGVHPAERDARRLSDAGLLVAAVVKAGWISRRELCLFPTLEAAMRRYPSTVIPSKRRPPRSL